MQMSAIVPFKVIFLLLSHLSQSRCYIHPKENSGGSKFCTNLARYMTTAAEDKKFYDLSIKTRLYKTLLSP